MEPWKLEHRRLLELYVKSRPNSYNIALSLTTDYLNPYYWNSRTQSVVTSYHKACSSHPIIWTIVAIKLANFGELFTPLHSDGFVSIKYTIYEEMIIMQSLDLAIIHSDTVASPNWHVLRSIWFPFLIELSRYNR